jgi:glycosyltransferase involved in cell wall biosynthesis
LSTEILVSGMNPIVTVVIRTYNRQSYLKEAIQSALDQTYRNLEVVVVDVGSTDNTPNLLQSFGNEIRHYRYHNRDHLAAMNFAVEKAHGEYLLLLDDDDKLFPHTAEKAVAVVRDNPEISIVTGRWRWVVDAENEVLLKENPPIDCENMLASLMKGNCVPSCGVLVEKQAIVAVGGYDESLPSCIDWDIWLRLAYQGYHFYWLDEFLGIVRMHTMNVQRDRVKIGKGKVEIMEKMNRLLQSREESELYGMRYKLCDVHLEMGVALKESGRTLGALKEFFLAMKYRSGRLFWLPLLVICAIALDRNNFRKLRKHVLRKEIASDKMLSYFLSQDS